MNQDTRTKQIELSGRQLERWEELRDKWSDEHLPDLTDEQMVKSLLDTVKAVDEGYYAE